MAGGERGWGGGRDIFRECRGGDRIWGRRGGKRLRRGEFRSVLHSQEWLCHERLSGLDELGAGADFDVGILQGGEGEAWVAKSLKVSFHILDSGRM